MALSTLYYKYLSPYKFVIGVKNGTATIIKGSVKNIFVYDCGEILSRNGVKSGIITGKETEGRIYIETSSNVPPHVAQQVRNVWKLTN